MSYLRNSISRAVKLQKTRYLRSYVMDELRVAGVMKNKLRAQREIQPLIFPGNKATDQNKSDNCEECEHLNQIVAENVLIRLVLGDIACQNCNKC